MSYNTQEMSEIRVSSKLDRTALTETLSYTAQNAESKWVGLIGCNEKSNGQAKDSVINCRKAENLFSAQDSLKQHN